MALRHLLVPFLIAATLMAWSSHGPSRACAGKSDAGQIEGQWLVWRSIKSGDTTAESGEGLIIDGKSFQLTLRGNKLAEKGSCSTKADADPKEIDLEHTFGRYKGKKQLGIYRFTAPGQLEISWGEPGSEKRPTKFTGKLGIGTGVPLAIYRSPDFKLPEPVAKELKALEGKWKIVDMHRFGRAEKNAASRGEGFLLEGEDVQFFYGGSTKGGKAQYFVDPTTSPKQIEIVNTVGQERYKSRIGIYRMKGNKLEISFSALNGETRPTAFTGVKGTPGAGDLFYVCEKE
jgi:uncharacterized protein (TIGR03067 family)